LRINSTTDRSLAMTNEGISPLRRRMTEDMTVRTLSPTTWASYIHSVKKFSQYFGRSPDYLGLEEVRACQVHFGVTGDCLGNAQASRLLAALFLWRDPGAQGSPRAHHLCARKTLPVILSPEEVAAFLKAVPSRRDRVALTTAYATGLRASEDVRLCTHDIDGSRMVIHVANGKGGMQRYVMPSPKLLRILRANGDGLGGLPRSSPLLPPLSTGESA
jgi:site-specific recombinase XerD